MHGDLSASLESAIAALSVLVPRADAVTPRARPTYIYGLDAAADTESYQLWLQVTRDRRTVRRAELQQLATDDAAPTISVCVPVYRPDVDLLRSCVDSVLGQSYGKWELCLCDDGSDDGATAGLLSEHSARDSRVKTTRLSTNSGIAAATNAAVALAEGTFIALLDQDDALETDAIGEVAAAVLRHPDADVLYTDQDKMDPEGARSEPYFKSGWNPDLLLSNMYLGHLLVIRRSTFDEVGGMRSAFDGSQDYDLALRATERARRVVHVPVIGYHWRRTPGSTALDYGAKPEADAAARRALQDALGRRGIDGTVESGQRESTFRVRRAVPSPGPLVSIIIPFHDGAGLLRKCLDGLDALAGYDHWQVLLVDNRSWEPETRALLRRYAGRDQVRLLEYPHPFNWSAINNWAVDHAEGDLLLFMNSDVEGRSRGWLHAMVEHAIRPEVGATGARLLYPDGRIQHAGIVLGLGGGVAWHAFCFCPPENDGYFAQTRVIRNYSGVTGACMMVRRDVFDALGRFDETMPVAFNDVDLCIRLREKGYLIVFTPFAELTHYEGASRGRGALETEETREMFRRWGDLIRNDPYFNPNLNPLRSEFQLAINAEEVDPWARVL